MTLNQNAARSRRLRALRWAATSGAAALAVATAYVPVAAAAGTGDPWSPVTQQAFTVPAGAYCDFAFHYEPERQNIQQRTLASWPDGTPKIVEFTGQLIGTTTNLETGESMRRSASGKAVEYLSADGEMLRYEMYGPVGFGFRAGDNYPQGYYLFHGQHVVEFAADGTRTMVTDRGVAENVCDTLG